MAKILLLDDDPHICKVIGLHLEKRGHEVEVRNDGVSGFGLAVSEHFDLLITDLRMPKMSGLELLKKVRSNGIEAPVIVMTAFASVRSAVEAMKQGASDYIPKPPQLDEITIKVERLLDHTGLVEENRKLRLEIGAHRSFPEIIGRSRALRTMLERLTLLARDPDISVLLSGETGTGKELAARAVHYGGPRAGQPFVAINCAALPENLLESELFGHEKGAFTGAGAAKKGLFEEANRGAVFLDEISSMSPKMQAKLLRALEQREIRRVGGTSARTLDVRIISASNKALEELVAAGEFREDLYYRIAVATVELPPLRDRAGDVRLLAQHFLDRFNSGKSKSLVLASGAFEALEKYSWPGNVRELENVIESLVATIQGSSIASADLPERIRRPDSEAPRLGDLDGSDLKAATKLLVERFEREFIRHRLNENDWNVSRTARKIGLSRGVLHSKIRTYGLEPDPSG